MGRCHSRRIVDEVVNKVIRNAGVISQYGKDGPREAVRPVSRAKIVEIDVEEGSKGTETQDRKPCSAISVLEMKSGLKISPRALCRKCGGRTVEYSSTNGS